MNAKFIQSKEKKEIIEELERQFGITNLPYLLIRTGAEKVRAYSGSLSKDEIMEIDRLVNIEIIGEYFLKQEGEIRLSTDAIHLLKGQITKNVIEIDEVQLHSWMRGQNIDLKSEPGVKIISHKGDFVGCGKSNGEKIFNFVPKERRLRK
jgi:CRISPR/Cas system CMR-associated protein Cmr3 (group 5 of RAMP superfamily)